MGLGVPETMLISAAVGAGTSAAKGGDPLLGAVLGAGGSAIGGAVLGAAAAPATTTTASAGLGDIASMASGLDGATIANSFSGTPPAITDVSPVSSPLTSYQQQLQADVTDLAAKGFPSPSATGGVSNLPAANTVAPDVSPVASPLTPYQQQLQAGMTNPTPTPATGSQFLQDPMKYLQVNKGQLIGAGIAGSMAPAAYNPAIMGGPEDDPNNPLRRYRFDPSRYRPGARGYAEGGGISSLPGYDMMVGEAPMYPRTMAAGGGISDLGSYSDGGRMLKGRGDGMSDSIPGVIAGKRPARLADGEFVVPADVVSHLGNGSTDAGAKQLYAMMDKVRAARTGTKKQGRQINPRRFMPA